MTEYELLRIIAFLEKTRAPYLDLLPIAEEDPAWNILIFVMRSHVSGNDVSISTIVSEAKVPYATALRRVHRLIADGHLCKVSRGSTGKSFFLVPSEALHHGFLRYAGRIKALLAETFGRRQAPEAEEDYYFGGSYFAGQIIPPPQLMKNLGAGEKELHFLLNNDNYFRAMRDMWADFRHNMASRENFHLLSLTDLYNRVQVNATKAVSDYDIVAIDMPWLGKVASSNAFRPLNSYIETSEISPMDFHPSVWSTGTWQEQQLGIPIYCTVELLAARADLFEAEELRYPTTFDETIAAAKHFHAPKKERYGIVWNGAQGRPIAQAFMILMSCCGSNVLNNPRPRFLANGNGLSEVDAPPKLVSDASLAALDYMHRLLAVSPPNILEMGWDERTQTFLRGKAALSYCWTVHAARFEYDINSVVKRRVKYLQQPRGPNGAPSNPIGGYLLCIPANLPEERAKHAFDAIAWMSSPEAMKAHVKNGFPLAPRFSVSADPEAAATSPIVSFVDKLGKSNLLTTWPRPAIPQYVLMEDILGVEIHRALRGEISDLAALKNAEQSIAKAFRS